MDFNTGSKVEINPRKRKTETEMFRQIKKLRSTNIIDNQTYDYSSGKRKLQKKKVNPIVSLIKFEIPKTANLKRKTQKEITSQVKRAKSSGGSLCGDPQRDELIALEEGVKMQLLLNQFEKNLMKENELKKKIQRRQNSGNVTDKYVAQLKDLNNKNKILFDFYHPDHCQLFYNEPHIYMAIIDWEKVLKEEFPNSGYSVDTLKYWWRKYVLKHDIKSNNVGSKVNGEELGCVLGNLYRLLTHDNDRSKTPSDESASE